MISNILVANRGEIACRIMRTIKKMGLRSTAIYSEADRNALHVRKADNTEFVGHSPATESYLSIPNILAAIHRSGANAIHPGYGFLSENASFCRRLEKEGIIFIGPSVNAIKKMGDKITSKKLAKEAGVSVVPGYMGVIKDTEEAIKIASEIGFPVMFKAAAGGGGKGMRVVKNAHDAEQAFLSTTREAQNSFGDDRIFIEKFITEPRHIEIQILADMHGNIVCLGERECSIQRHHQKVIEEAPSTFIDEPTRQKMYAQCISLAKKVGYYSAGTVEFIVDRDKNFYFLEMNTRLQVEHCVTELITGIDIVEQMIRIANKEHLGFSQKDITLKGWAIESRIYAEDPSRGFLPSSGRITEYKEPRTIANTRIDTGVYEGGEVSMFYDAMIAKLCTYGETRNEAITHMKEALGQYVIRGISHNIDFLQAVFGHAHFIAGDITTNFINQEYPEGFLGKEADADVCKRFLASAVYMALTQEYRASRIPGQVEQDLRMPGTRWIVDIAGKNLVVYAVAKSDGYHIKYENKKFVVDSDWNIGNSLFLGTIDTGPFSVQVQYLSSGYRLTSDGSSAIVKVRSPRTAELEKFMKSSSDSSAHNMLEAPISGKVVSLHVQEGACVKANAPLIIIEAMKMENVLHAERDVTIKKLYIKEGDTISAGQELIEFEVMKQES